ncbi:LamG-like jellyroll fold domain-containing protein [Thomasclavelia cocleata]|uniref:LamG-like jellyroll fold domain-containing protein n=2 Tax=Thomasclavelia cocleata TaxID=69824 RepID=UPI00242D0FD8|nr:LamG-like jellyroll fold domain-containing protein [Thomasclavelia cocleata]
MGTRYVEIPDMQLGTRDFTISMWFKSNERKNDTIIFSNKTGDSGRNLGIFFCNYDVFLLMQEQEVQDMIHQEITEIEL